MSKRILTEKDLVALWQAAGYMEPEDKCRLIEDHRRMSEAIREQPHETFNGGYKGVNCRFTQ